MKKIIIRSLFLLAVIIGFTGCRSVPITGRKQLMLTTSGYENELGVTSYAEYQEKYPRSTNAEYNRALENCGRAIAQASGQTDFDWQFTVLQTNTQNAFCLPGGKVAVYSGIMDVMQNEAELAFVVAHEVGHAIARHGGERMSWGYLQSFGGLLVALGFQSDLASSAYSISTQVGVMLPFSRSNESEADLIGLILMSRAGYDPQASVQFWSRFSQDSKSSAIGNLMSTHPCDAKRIEAMKQNMAMAEAEYQKAQNKKGFGMVFHHGR
ncbi:MAG: M48 family metallopeptidase [Lentisphaeria bacterium]|nr:M48 family metallopeptidase [Lentisphaeria bacterium]